jgi:hypothetical protein
MYLITLATVEHFQGDFDKDGKIFKYDLNINFKDKINPYKNKERRNPFNNNIENFINNGDFFISNNLYIYTFPEFKDGKYSTYLEIFTDKNDIKQLRKGDYISNFFYENSNIYFISYFNEIPSLFRYNLNNESLEKIIENNNNVLSHDGVMSYLYANDKVVFLLKILGVKRYDIKTKDFKKFNLFGSNSPKLASLL